jgi:hypothetical protein
LILFSRLRARRLSHPRNTPLESIWVLDGRYAAAKQLAGDASA